MITVILLSAAIARHQGVIDEKVIQRIREKQYVTPAMRLGSAKPLTDLLDLHYPLVREREIDLYLLDSRWKYSEEPNRLAWLAYHRDLIVRDARRQARLNELSNRYDAAYEAFAGPGKSAASLNEAGLLRQSCIEAHIRIRCRWWTTFSLHRWPAEGERGEGFNMRVVRGLAEAFRLDRGQVLDRLGMLDYCLSHMFSGYDEAVQWLFSR
jgi:DNA-directed RNA polymerase subunit N (RpoN/RPB10)